MESGLTGSGWGSAGDDDEESGSSEIEGRRRWFVGGGEGSRISVSELISFYRAKTLNRKQLRQGLMG